MPPFQSFFVRRGPPHSESAPLLFEPADVPGDVDSMGHPEGDGDLSREDGTSTRRALRKVDCYLIPLLFLTYMLNFMDKTILSSASVFGLIEDTVNKCSQLQLERTSS